MLDRHLIQKKIRSIQEYFEELTPILDLAKGDILADIRNYKTLERNFQLMVDCMIDVNAHFIEKLNLKSPDDFQSTFVILGESNILPDNFAQRVAPVVGMRNRLVHRYEELDKKLFIGNFQKYKQDFLDYSQFINNYLTEHPEA